MKKITLTLIALFCLLQIQAQTVELFSDLAEPRGLLIEGDDLYFCDLTSVKKIDLSQSTLTIETIFDGLDVGAGLAIKDGMLYVSDFNGGKIWKMDITANIPFAELVISDLGFPNMMAIKDSDLYFTSNDENIIAKIDLTDPNPVVTTILSDPGYLIGIEIFGDDLFYSSIDSYSIKRIDLSETNPTPELLFDGYSSPQGLRRCGSDIFMTSRYSNEVLKFNPTCDNMTLQNVTIDIAEPRQTAIHDGFIYVFGMDSENLTKTPISDLNCSVDVQVACSSLTWLDGNTYTSSTNLPTYALTNAAGCDSIITLNLTITDSIEYSTDSQTACLSFTWIDGLTYTSSTNTPSFNYVLANGCDSIVTLDLTINQVNSEVNLIGNDSLIAAAIGASYQWLDCANNFAPINGATNQTFVANSNGSYAVQVTENDCVDTSACTQIIVTSIDETNLFAALSIYPNPTEGEVSIDFGNLKNPEVEVYSALGELVTSHRNIVGAKFSFQLEGVAGVYFVRLRVGEVSKVWRVLKI